MPHSTWGGGTESELIKFDLQKFATVSNPYTISSLNDHFTITGKIIPPLVDLRSYSPTKVKDYFIITELPRENIEYLSSGLIASKCENTFFGLRKLISLPYNEFNINTRYCTTMYYMFGNCASLSSLNISGMSTISCTNMTYMFAYCTNLQEIICPDGLDLSSCTDIDHMFINCNSYSGEPLHFKNVLRDLDFSRIDGTKGTHYVIDNYKY